MCKSRYRKGSRRLLNKNKSKRATLKLQSAIRKLNAVGRRSNGAMGATAAHVAGKVGLLSQKHVADDMHEALANGLLRICEHLESNPPTGSDNDNEMAYKNTRKMHSIQESLCTFQEQVATLADAAQSARAAINETLDNF